MNPLRILALAAFVSAFFVVLGTGNATATVEPAVAAPCEVLPEEQTPGEVIIEESTTPEEPVAQ